MVRSRSHPTALVPDGPGKQLWQDISIGGLFGLTLSPSGGHQQARPKLSHPLNGSTCTEKLCSLHILSPTEPENISPRFPQPKGIQRPILSLIVHHYSYYLREGLASRIREISGYNDCAQSFHFVN